MLIHKLNFEWFSYVLEYLCSTVSSLVWFDYWSPSYGWKGPMNQGLSILSFGSFLGIGSRGPCSAVHVSRIFWRNFFLSQRWEKWAKNRVFWINWKICHYCFLNLVYKESSYYLVYSCTNPRLGKNLFPEILAKMLLANQIAGFLNRPNL